MLELRQYTLKPGRRDALIELFDAKFVDGQENAGMTIVGQFRDLDAPDRFVWLRGFADMQQRKQALEAFYYGPVWKADRDIANGTMIDSDNVLLLRPATASSGFALRGLARDQRPPGLVVAHIQYLDQPANAAVLQDLEQQFRVVLQAPGTQLHALLVSEHSENTFAALPVRRDEEAVVWIAGFADRATYETCRAELDRIAGSIALRNERLHLSPTKQSLLRGSAEKPLP